MHRHGREARTIDALGKSRRTEYDNANNVSARVDALGYRTRYEYDERNNLAAEFGPEAGQETRYEYDPNNNRNKEIWPNGRVVSISYDARDRRHVTSDQRGVIETRTWWPDGPLKSVTDADGRVTRQFHDGLHRLFREELPGLPLRARTFGHSIHGEVVSETDARQHLTTHEVDTLGRRTASILPAVDSVTARLETQYDDAGNIERQIDGRGIVTAFVHNALNQRTDQTDTQTCSESGSGGDARHQSWTYDTQGNVITHTDRRGIVSVSSHDLENRLLTHSRDGVLQQRIERDDQGNVHFQWDAEGRKTTFGYDKAHRKNSEDRSGLALETWTYTPLGDLDTHTDADGYQTVRHYDLRRQLDEETRAGETTVYTYYDAGQRKTLQRPNGAPWTWHYGYDSAGRLHTVTSPEGHETTFGYDAADNRDSITDARQHETTFAYDGRNRLSGKTYPGGKNWQWRYDAANNRIRTEAPNGRISTTDYDNLQRPTLTQYLDAPTGEVQQTQSRYDGNGNPRSVVETSTAGTRTETRHYDRFDRPDDIADGDGRTLSYRYDKAGNRTERTDHDQQTTVWHYNALNQNDRVFTPGLGTTEQKHTPGGRLDLVTRPDGSLTDYGYTVTGRLETIAHQKAGNAIASYRYTYDPNGNRTLQQETNGAVSGGVTQDTTYLYDHDDRLTEVHEPGRNTIYTLDPVGNRTGEEVRNGSGMLISHSTLIYNDRDQLTSRTDPVAGITLSQTWDDNGNLATQTSNGQTRTYSYDARDRLTALALPSAPSLSFRYHANGLRREKTDGTQTTRYHYDDQSLLAETNAIGNTQRQYHYSADQLIAQTEAGTTPTHRQYLLDGLRSPIALLTSQGAVSARTSYDAFGEIRAQQKTGGNLVTPLRDQANASLTNEDEQPFGFTGYLKDGESGLYYAKARYYDPATARFTTEDSEAGKDLEPPSLHRYLYANANPTYYVDPNGRSSATVGGAMVGAVFGTVQSLTRASYDWYWGEWQGFGNYGSVIAQNTIAGAEIGLALDASRGGVNPATGAVMGGAMSAGISTLTFDGTARDWTAFGNNQVKYGTGGAVTGALLATGQVGPAASSLGLRFGTAAVAGATSGYAGDLTTQGVEFVTGERSELDASRLNYAAAFGAFANMLPVAAGQISTWRDNATRPRAITEELAESTSAKDVQLVWQRRSSPSPQEPWPHSKVVFGIDDLEAIKPPGSITEPVVLGPYRIQTQLPDGRILPADTLQNLTDIAKKYNGRTLQEIKNFTIELAAPELDAAESILFAVPNKIRQFGRTNQEMELIQSQEKLRDKTTFILGELPEPAPRK